jgi:hypothetical protein
LLATGAWGYPLLRHYLFKRRVEHHLHEKHCD